MSGLQVMRNPELTSAAVEGAGDAVTGAWARARLGWVRMAMALALLAPAGLPANLWAREIGLEEAIELALRNNPDLEATARELTISSGQLEAASYLSQYNPVLFVEGNYRYRTLEASSQDWRIGLSQEMEIFGQRKLRMQAAKLGLDGTQANLRDRIRLLVAAVKLTFLEAMRAREQMRLLRELERFDFRLMETARRRLKDGKIGQIDFNLAVVRHGQSDRALLESRGRYRVERSSLGRLLGASAGLEPEPAGEFIAAPVAADLDTLVARAMHSRPDLRARELEVARLKTEAALNARLALPNIVAGAFGGHVLNNEYPMGVSLEFPLPIFNRRQGEATTLHGRRLQAEARLRATQLDIEQEVRNAYNRYMTAREILAIYKDEVVAPAAESFNLLEAEFNAGKIGLLSLSVAEHQAFNARFSYLDAWFNLRAAYVALDLALGA